MVVGRRLARYAGPVLVAALLVAGCTGQQPPIATSTPALVTPYPSATTPAPDTQTALPPERPEAMTTPSPDGAAAAATYFVSLYPYVFATGDLTEWAALSADDCKYCLNTQASVEDQVMRGVKGEGSEIEVHNATGTELSPGDTYSADLEITQAPSFEVSHDGSRVPDGEGGTFAIHVALLWRDGWLVRAVDATRM